MALHVSPICRSSTPRALYVGPAGWPLGSVIGPQIDLTAAAEAGPARTSVSARVSGISERRRTGEGNTGPPGELRAGRRDTVGSGPGAEPAATVARRGAGAANQRDH